MEQGNDVELATLRIENAMLAERLEAREADLAAARNGGPPLAPAEVSALAEELLGGLGSALPGMKLRDGELRLRIGADEVSVRFDRAVGQRGP